MDIRTLEGIQQKIATLKDKKARAEGALETIKQGWEKTYGFSTLEEAEAKEKELTEERDKLNTLIEDTMAELKGLTNWGLI